MEANTSLPTHPGPRIRSSIACARCRRSKIKCVNSGVDSTCKACESSGRECSYPPPALPGTNVKREGGELNGENSGEANKRHRHRKSEVSGGVTGGVGYRSSLGNAMNGAANGVSPRKESATAAQSRSGALDPSVLTPSLWQEVFEIFQLHFSADLPFLHGPAFLDPTRGAYASLIRIRSRDERTRSYPVRRCYFLQCLLSLQGFIPALYHTMPPELEIYIWNRSWQVSTMLPS